VTEQQRYDTRKQIERDPTISRKEAQDRLRILAAFPATGTLTEFRDIIRQGRNPLTDRAKRYRAQKNAPPRPVVLGVIPGDVAEATAEIRAIPQERRADYAEQIARENPFKSEAQRRKFYAPPGRKICNFCARRENIDVDHITGDESDGDPRDLMYLCRPCNTRKRIAQSRNRVGVRTRQYNPAQYPRTLRQFKNCAAVVLGVIPGDVAEATAEIRATPPERRADYAEQIARENPFKSEAQRRKFYAMLGRGEITRQQFKDFERHANPIQLLLAQEALQRAGSKAWEKIRPAKNPPTYGQFVVCAALMDRHAVNVKAARSFTRHRRT